MYLRAPRPAGAGLSGAGPRVDIDEPARRRTLREGAEQVRLAVRTLADADAEIERQVVAGGADGRDDLRLSALEAEHHVAGRLDEGDAEGKLACHDTYYNPSRVPDGLALLWAISPARHRPDDQKGLLPVRHRVGQRGVRRLVRQVLLAGEEPHERPAPLRGVVADRPAQHRIGGLDGVDQRALGRRALDLDLHFAADVRQVLQMRRQLDADHRRV